MRRNRFLFIEPSKVGNQHITLIDGYLKSLHRSQRVCEAFELVLCTSASTFEKLSAPIVRGLRHVRIPVMNPEKRRLVRKTLLEFVVLMRFIVAKRKADVVFVSCVLPSTLFLLEAANMVMRRSGIHVVLHGEIEALMAPAPRNPGAYGFWVARWIGLRSKNSVLGLVVIDDFIKEKLTAKFPNLTSRRLSVVHHPITAISSERAEDESPDSACFIGYRTPAKGFDQFVNLCEGMPDITFLAIGGGNIENLRSKAVARMLGSDDYLMSIAACDVAIFPYKSGYEVSLSAAAVDALSAGVHIVASDRTCFSALRERLGAEVVTVCRTPEEMASVLGTPGWLRARRLGQKVRIANLASTPYGLNAVAKSFESLAFSSGVGCP